MTNGQPPADRRRPICCVALSIWLRDGRHPLQTLHEKHQSPTDDDHRPCAHQLGYGHGPICSRSHARARRDHRHRHAHRPARLRCARERLCHPPQRLAQPRCLPGRPRPQRARRVGSGFLRRDRQRPAQFPHHAFLQHPRHRRQPRPHPSRRRAPTRAVHLRQRPAHRPRLLRAFALPHRRNPQRLRLGTLRLRCRRRRALLPQPRARRTPRRRQARRSRRRFRHLRFGQRRVDRHRQRSRPQG